VLWGDAAPTSAVNLVQTYVSRLRRILQPRHTPQTRPGIVTLDPGGYRLNIGVDQLDLSRFRTLLRKAHTAATDSPDEAADLLGQALALWRGDALADIDMLAGHPLLVTVADELIAATVQYADLVAAMGSHHRALPKLRELTGRYPLHESLHARLMVALAATGSQAAALTVFDQIKQRLADELGIDPGPDLLEYRQRVLRQDWTPGQQRPGQTPTDTTEQAPATRAQLPLDIHGFTGRTEELAQLDQIAAAGDQPTAVVISALSGTAGVGKTALAIHWAHRIRDRFPDGQLYVNLRGFDPTGPISPGEAIRGFLDAFTVPVAAIPAGLDAQAALYRSLLAGKRVLIVLDNARDADQVRPLLPGAPGCLVVVTSRERLTGLAAVDGAHPITVDLPTAAEARDMLARRVGSGRVAAEPDTTNTIIELCARLPLALAIMAARAAAQPGFPLAVLADELRDSRTRLDALASGGDRAADVRAVFSWSYQALTPGAARLFRLLGLHPGPDIGVPAAASLAGLPPTNVRPLLADLARASLVNEPAPGRYTLHDLLRAYATDQTHGIDSQRDQRIAVHRMLDHYLHTALGADRLLNPARNMIAPASTQSGVTIEQFADHHGALTWFIAEHHVLLAALDQAAANGFDAHTWQLAWSLAAFLQWRGQWSDWATAERAAVAAAGRLADPIALAGAHRRLAKAYIELGRHDEAHTEMWHALDLFTQAGDRVGQADTHNTIGWAQARQGRYPEALHHAQQALGLSQAAEYRHGQAHALQLVGWLQAHLGDPEQTLTACERALTLFQEIDDHSGAAATWESLGYAHHRLGHHPQAITCYQQTVELYRERVGDRYYNALALNRIAETHHATSNLEAARDFWLQAIAILDDIKHPDAASVRSRLAALDITCPEAKT
jgi:DNA-binding SARP family transcriptional activator/tetratricopeptide (TPR) repeat protein